MNHGHSHGGTRVTEAGTRFALVGSPNSGKTTLFNALTGLRAKTGNYPGVTVARYEGTTVVGGEAAVVEDLPGAYSLDPISPDERVVCDVLDAENDSLAAPDALLLTADATTLRRNLNVIAQVLGLELPTCVILTFGDELARRGGAVDVPALERALGVPVIAVAAGERAGLEQLRMRMGDPGAWSRPIVLPPTDPAEVGPWVESVLIAAGYRPPGPDTRSSRLDDVLLHPIWGTATFFALMFAFFQVLFTLAAPLQAGIETLFGRLGEVSAARLPGVLGRFVSEALIGGVGGVLVFLPQIVLLFTMISLLEGTGYMSRAAFLMDRVMGRFGLEGRAFVAMLSSLACAIPGIMATRTLPSARDRIATMMAAPLMTCSARVPVYVMLIALLVPDLSVGPFRLQGLAMFGLYVAGAVAAMATAAVFSRIAGRRARGLPFYMEMPPYRAPSPRSVALSVWDAAKGFLRKVTSIILLTTVLLWVALSLPLRGEAELERAGVDTADRAAVDAYTLEHSVAATIGRAVEPVLEPLGFDWRINVGVLASLSAREVFVATMGQIAAAEDPEDPAGALAEMTWTSGPNEGKELFTPGTVAALIVFFIFALQCFATLGVMRRETGGWRWPAVAFTYMLALAWGFGWLAHTIVTALA